MRMTGPAALDSTRDHARPTGIGDMQEILQQAAATLGSDDAIDPTWRADPLWSAVAAVRDAGDRYGGDAHLDAARQLLAAGEPVRAFDALTTAASFSAVCKRVSDVTALHEAREIASRQDWSEIEESLLRVPDPSPEE
jgi:hypothetical protein